MQSSREESGIVAMFGRVGGSGIITRLVSDAFDGSALKAVVRALGAQEAVLELYGLDPVLEHVIV